MEPYSPEEQRIYLEKLLAEKSAHPVPLVGNLLTSLLSLLDVAEELAHNRPEYAAAVTSFSQEIRKIKKELLMSAFEIGSVKGTQPIVAELIHAVMIVLLMKESYPEKRDFLTKLDADLDHAWGELIRRVRPDVKPQA